MKDDKYKFEQLKKLLDTRNQNNLNYQLEICERFYIDNNNDYKTISSLYLNSFIKMLKIVKFYNKDPIKVLNKIKHILGK